MIWLTAGGFEVTFEAFCCNSLRIDSTISRDKVNIAVISFCKRLRKLTRPCIEPRKVKGIKPKIEKIMAASRDSPKVNNETQMQ